jgi:CRISPR-associated protein Cmr3
MSKQKHKGHNAKNLNMPKTPTPTAALLPLAGPQVWRFEALDTWFFRESRPLDAVGGAQLTSHFPPPARTLIGAIRTTLGDALRVNWADYQKDQEHPLRKLIGSPDNLGPLRFTGPYPMRDGERLYPAPLVVMQRKDTDAAGKERVEFTRLQPGEAVACDLGRVRLPIKQRDLPGAKPLEGQWLTKAGLEAVLDGGTPAAGDVIDAKTLCATEPRLGIALDEHARRPIDGLLYQTRHVRPASDTAVGITLEGFDPAHWPASLFAQQGLARLGGEGRPAAWSRQPHTALPKTTLQHGDKRLMLCLLGPTRFENGWLPDGFTPQTDADGQVTGWQGELAGRRARLVCAVTGKPVREGGWDLVGNRPRDLHALVPAGSCYFLEFDRAEDARAVAEQCHGQQIGLDTAWGGGQVAVGRW